MRTRSILLTLTFSLLASAAVAQDARTEFGLERARLLEAALMSMYPGTTAIEWGETIDLVQGTTRVPLRITDVDYRPDDETGGGYTAVMTVEHPNERQPIYDKLEAYEPAPSRALSELVAFKTNAQFGITALRRGSLGDAFSAIEEVQDVELATLTYDKPWPDVYVTYTAVYGTPEFFGEIRWDEKLVVEPAIAAENRIPSLLWRIEKTGARHNDTATVEAPDVNTLAFLSETSHQVITRCTDPCLPDGRVILALWWTTVKP
jgi:hypothetical protein